MSSWLYRWGALAYRGKWWVTAIWVVLIAAIVGLIVVNPPKLSNESGPTAYAEGPAATPEATGAGIAR